MGKIFYNPIEDGALKGFLGGTPLRFRSNSVAAAWVLWGMLLCLMVDVGIANGSDPVKIRRFAFVVGANDGGTERAKLRFANTDAKAFASVLVDLGGVSRRDLLLFTNANRRTLVTGFIKMTRMLNAAKKRGEKTEVLFYYSGHSDERGLLLGNEIYFYKDIKKQMDTMPARIRIGVLDSCASGTLVRVKGGKRTTPFLVDSSSEVKGVALLTSSAADESAQESDSVGGSYFTHFLVSGMRGAADANRDGRVTINESYAYAFDETLYRTADTQAGPQHPNYDFRLAGAGDLVLTDLRETNAVMLFASEIEGRIFVRDRFGHLIAEINKRSNRPIKLGVQPGRYEVVIVTAGTLRRANVKVTSEHPTRINANTGRTVSRLTTVSKGSKQAYRPGEKAERHRPVALGIFPGVSTNGDKSARNNLALNIAGKGHSLYGLEVGFWANIRTHRTHGIQLSNFYNDTGILRGAQYAAVNVSRRSTRGIQMGAINVGHSTRGAQAGVANINGDTFAGYQGGVVNVTVDMNGVQTGVANIQSGEMRGFQLSLMNFAAALDGVQLGAANINRFYLRGAQLGFFNFSRATSGLQVGLINLAVGDFKGAQIGLINYSGNGIFAPVFWVSDTAVNNTAFKFGNRYTYGIIGGSAHSFKRNAGTGLLAGFGVHIEFHPIWMEVDVLYHALTSNENDGLEGVDGIAKLRWTMGYRLFDQVSFFVGPTLNYLNSEFRTSVSKSPALSFVKYDNGNIHHELSLGMIAGVQWEPKWNKHNSWRGRKYDGD